MDDRGLPRKAKRDPGRGPPPLLLAAGLLVVLHFATGAWAGAASLANPAAEKAAGTPPGRGNAAASGAKPSAGPTLGQQVNDAIKAGVKFLRSKQLADGNFDDGARGRYPDGVASLALLALLKSGVPHDDPAVRRAYASLRYVPYTRTYSTAIRIMALEALGREDEGPAIRSAAKWLVAQFRKSEHAWGYPDGAADLSNTQYAVLGLWTAERHGFRAPRDLWIDLAQRVMRHQNPSGGFAYHIGEESRGSMTTAGLTVLSICLERIPKGHSLRAEVRDALERGWANLERRFNPAGNPVGEHAFYMGYYYYYLYGLERACAIGGRRKLGDRDWYKEGAARLVAIQHDDGSFGTLSDTCFSLLFLRLSTYTTLGKKKGSNLAGAAGRKKSTIRPVVNIPFADKWLLLGPFDDQGEAAFEEDLIGEKAADPRKGSVSHGLKWEERLFPLHFVDLDETFEKRDHVLAYAFCRLRAERDARAILWFGSDDGARIFLDGKLVFDHHFRASEPPDAHALPVFLAEGRHRLLVKVADYTGKWGFHLRFSGEDGSFLPGVAAFTNPAGPTARDVLAFEAPFLGARETFDRLPADRKTRLGFDSPADLSRVLIVQNRPDNPGIWIDRPDDLPKTRTQDGARGLVLVHPLDGGHPVRLYRKVHVAGTRSRLVVRVAACSPEISEKADWVARLGVYTAKGKEAGKRTGKEVVKETGAAGNAAGGKDAPGDGILWSSPEVVSAGTKAAPAGWREISLDLGRCAGRDILAILECAAGGPGGGWMMEYAFIDSFSVRGF